MYLCVILTNNLFYGLISVITGGNIMGKGELFQCLYIKMQLKGIKITTEYEIVLNSFIERIYDLSLDIAEPLNLSQTDMFRKRFGILSPYKCQTLDVIANAYKTNGEEIRKTLINSEEQIIRYIKVQTALKNISLDTSLNDLNISIRTRNSLFRMNIMTIRDVLSYSKCELLKVRGIGINGVTEIDSLMRMLGYSLKYDERNNSEDDLNTSIKYLNLPTRLQNALFRMGIFTVEELITYCRNDLLKIGGIGTRGVENIEFALQSLGYQLTSNTEVIDHNCLQRKTILEQLNRIRSFIIEEQKRIDEYSNDASLDYNKHIK